MHKGHGRRTPSGLRSTKTKQGPLFDDCDDAFGADQEAQLPLYPVKKEKTISFRVLDLADEATQKIWSDQPGRFPKKSSKGNQYIMVHTESDSNIILVEAMKNCSSGEMIRAYQPPTCCQKCAQHQKSHHVPYYIDIFVKSSWNVQFRDYQYLFHLEKLFYQLGMTFFNLLHPSISLNVQIITILDGFSCPTRKVP
jgi:hypothetical protein